VNLENALRDIQPDRDTLHGDGLRRWSLLTTSIMNLAHWGNIIEFRQPSGRKGANMVELHNVVSRNNVAGGKTYSSTTLDNSCFLNLV
jgi:hypothetical protein